MEEYDPTIEDSRRKQTKIDGVSCTFDILDTAGQEDYKELRPQWLRGQECILLVYSISSQKSFDSLQELKDLILRIESDSTGTRPRPIMIVGNKCDKLQEREVKTQDAVAFAKAWSDDMTRAKDPNNPGERWKGNMCDAIEVSARDGTNVERCFFDVVRKRWHIEGETATSPTGTTLSGLSGFSRRRDDSKSEKSSTRKSKCVIL